MKKLYFLLFTLLIASMSFGQTIYDADFTTDGDGFADHTTASPPAPAPASVSGGIAPNDWILRYDTAPNTDGSSNSFSVSGGALVSDDWGGQGIFESASIDVSTYSNVNISALTQVTGANGNLFTYFYILDGGARVDLVMTDFTSDLVYSISGLDVSAANSLVVGFEFDENGSGDGYTTTSFAVENAACGVSFGTVTYTCGSNTLGNNNDTVIINIPYTGSNAVITSVTTTAVGAMVAGDNPATTPDGTITITGLSEGDAWNIALSGGDCDAVGTSGTVPAAECDPLPNTCYDLSLGMETFELVTITANSQMDEWSLSGGTYSMNGFCGGGCVEPIETWMVFGPLDMTAATDLALSFDATEDFGVTDLVIAYTSAYSGCPSGTTWTTAQTLTDAGSFNVDLSMATGTDVFIGVQYVDDGVDGFSGWNLSNVSLDAFGACPTLGMRPTSDCAICDVTLQTENYVCGSSTAGANNDTVTIEIPYTGLEATITSLSTTSMGMIAGDNPALVMDGTITITGLGEGDAWDLTINGGDCDATTISGTVAGTQCDPTFLIINEINADPSNNANGEGDANGDGVAEFDNDEFVEIYNTSTSPIDMSNFVLSDASSDRHVFPAGTMLPGESFITVFGGGTPTGVPGIVQTASTMSVGLSNGGDTVTLKNDIGVTQTQVIYTGAGNNQSIARDPDFSGPFVQHSTIVANPVLFSPGKRNDDPSLSVDQLFDSNGFSIYPNPTNTGFVNIKTTSNEAVNVTVFDILGKQVISETLNNNRLNVSNLNSGIYILRLSQNGAATTKKLVIK